MVSNSFGVREQLPVDDTAYSIYRLDHLGGTGRLPYSLKVLLENLLRNEDGRLVTAEQINALIDWQPEAEHGREVAFTPARVLMQDFTGVPCVVDLVAMRDAIATLGGDTARINPLCPTELVIDHSVIADVFGRPDAFRINAELEFERNAERLEKVGNWLAPIGVGATLWNSTNQLKELKERKGYLDGSDFLAGEVNALSTLTPTALIGLNTDIGMKPGWQDNEVTGGAQFKEALTDTWWDRMRKRTVLDAPIRWLQQRGVAPSTDTSVVGRFVDPREYEGTFFDRLQLGFEGKSGPHAFKIMTDFIEAKGWKAIRYGGSSMDSIYEKDGATFSFEVHDPKKPLMDLQFPAEDALKRLR